MDWRYGNLEGLLSIFESIIGLQEKLAVLLAEERQCVLGKNAEALLKILGEKESLVSQLRYYDKKRKAEIERFVVPEGGTLRQWLRGAPGPHGYRLGEAQMRLEALTARILEENRENARLIEQMLGRVKNLTAFMQGVMTTDITYKPTGMLREVQPLRRTIGKG